MEVDRVDEAVPLDDAARDALLESLLQRYPGAVVTAMDVDGRLVELPPSVARDGQQVPGTRSALDLFEAGSRAAMFLNWERAKLVGSAAAPVVLVNGVDASCYVIDVRHSHGVFVGMIVADGEIELASSLADRPPIMPKTGRIDKDEVAIIRFADERICQILGYEPGELIGPDRWTWSIPRTTFVLSTRGWRCSPPPEALLAYGRDTGARTGRGSGWS